MTAKKKLRFAKKPLIAAFTPVKKHRNKLITRIEEQKAPVHYTLFAIFYDDNKGPVPQYQG